MMNMLLSYGSDFLKDRVIQGLIAGIAGWLPQMIYTFTVFGFHLAKFRYLDFGAITAFSQKPHGVFEFVFAESLVLAMQGLLGIAFAMLIKVISNPNIILKGGLYGGILWVVIYSIFSLYKMKGIYGIIDFNTAIFHCIAAIIWGITMAGAFLFLNRKFDLKN